MEKGRRKLGNEKGKEESRGLPKWKFLPGKS